MSVAAVVLAAGAATRYGAPKQRELLPAVLAALSQTDVAPVIVVQGASRDGVTVTMKDFVKAGLPVTAATLVLSTVLIALLVPV